MAATAATYIFLFAISGILLIVEIRGKRLFLPNRYQGFGWWALFVFWMFHFKNRRNSHTKIHNPSQETRFVPSKFTHPNPLQDTRNIPSKFTQHPNQSHGALIDPSNF